MMQIKKKLTYLYYEIIKKDRNGFARLLGVQLGDGCKILSNPLSAFGSEPWLIRIGNHVEITSGVHPITHDGSIWVLRELDPECANLDIFGPIVIHDNVFIGVGSIILPGVTIGENSIIAAGSVVSKDVPPNCVYGGVPARKLSDLPDYIERKKQTAVPTKHMTQAEKRKWLMENRPEMFQ